MYAEIVLMLCFNNTHSRKLVSQSYVDRNIRRNFKVILTGSMFLFLTFNKRKQMILYFLKVFIYLFWWGREGEREGEKHQCVIASHMFPTWDLTRNPGMCHDWESNQ